MKKLLAVVLAAGTVSAYGVTNEIAPNVYRITESVDFELKNIGQESFTFTWTDSNGTIFEEVVDPTLLLSATQTYTFKRETSAHPFRITNSTLPVEGTDGSFRRTTQDGALIDLISLQPIDDFTADPAPTDDFIEWTPRRAEIGDYFYTCRVLSHVGMTGGLAVEGNLLDLVVLANSGSGKFDTLIAAVLKLLPEFPQLGEILTGRDEFTVFAPTDHAFERAGITPENIDELFDGPEELDALFNVIAYHVTEGRQLVDDFKNFRKTTIVQLNGDTAHVLRFKHRLRINRARVIEADIEASNGAIHVINRVLDPS